MYIKKIWLKNNGEKNYIYESTYKYIWYISFIDIYIYIYIYIDTYIIMKKIHPPDYIQNGFMATHALGHMMCGYTLVLPVKDLRFGNWALCVSWITYDHLWPLT